MTTPKTRQAYLSLYTLFDQALATPTGVRFQVESYAAAVNLRMRLHAARQVDRDANGQIYEKGMNLWYASIYDPLTVRIQVVDDPDGPCWVILERNIPKIIGQIEPLQANPENYEWLQSLDQRPIDTIPEAAPNFLPNTGSTSGTKLLTKSSESTSDAPSDDSSSTPSTKPESAPKTQGLRRL